MHDENAFLRAIQDNPRDDAARLIYADWLEERGDERAEYIRNQHQLTKTPYGDVEHYRIHARQRYLRDTIDRSWLEAMGYRHWPIELTAENFEREVLHCPRLVLARFWAPWSGPCRLFGATIAEVADEGAGLISVGNVNVDEQPDLAARYEIAAVSMTVFFLGGQDVGRLLGLCDRTRVNERVAAIVDGQGGR